jgi:hypothetical protein
VSLLPPRRPTPEQAAGMSQPGEPPAARNDAGDAMNRKTVGVCALVVLFAACDESATDATGDSLSRAEAFAIASAVAEVSADASDRGIEEGSASAGLTVAAEPKTISFDHTSSHPCPTAGRITVGLEAVLVWDRETNAAELDANGSLTHDACAFPHEGLTLTVTGNPSLTVTSHAATSGGRPSEPWTSEAGGTFSWSASDGRSGTCGIDVGTVTDFDARSRTVQGEVCGHSVDQTITWN